MPWSGLVAEIKSGNECGVDAFFTAISGCARAQLLPSVEPQVVDDCVQEVLIVVMQAIRRGALRDPNCLMGYVRTVARRQVAVHIRHAVTNRQRLVSVEATTAPAAPTRDSPEARAALRERALALKCVLQQLCLRDREILVRFYYEEQGSEQICREMRLTATQFRLYKSRALAKCNDLTPRPKRTQSTSPLRIA